MRIYVHRDGRHEADAVDTEETIPIAEALSVGDGDGFVALEDSDDPLDVSATFAAAGVADRAHVFAGRPRRIDVVVSFNGEQREREFGPSTRVERVFRWATGKQGFGLSDADGAEHMLALVETGATPPGDVHLGSLDNATPGRVAFTLIPKHRYEG